MADAQVIALPEEYTVRHARDQDIPQIIDLIAACDGAFGNTDDSYTPTDIRADWAGLDLERDTWVITAPGGSLAAYATLTDEGLGQFTGDGYVHPDHWRGGLGRALLRLTEARAREMIGSAPENAQVTLLTRVLAEDEAAQALLASEGYSLARVFFRMRIDLTEPPPPPIWPQGYRLRPFEPGRDERRVYETVMAAFADHWGYTPTTYEEWVEGWPVEDRDYSLWFLLEDERDGTLAAVTLGRNRPDMGWIRNVATRREHRKRGLARALLLHTFGVFWERGERVIGLGVDAHSLTGAVQLYESAGMRPAMRILTYEKVLRPGKLLVRRTLDDAVEGEPSSTAENGDDRQG